MRSLISVLFISMVFVSCGNVKTPQEIIDDIRYFGHDETIIINNTEVTEAQKENELGIVEVIDPCGNETAYDEVLVRMSDDVLMAFFAQHGGRLSLLGEGSYKTTDGTNCKFDVIEVDGRLEVVSK